MNLKSIINHIKNIKKKNKHLNIKTLPLNEKIDCTNENRQSVISGSEAIAAFQQLISYIQRQPECTGKFSEKYISTLLKKILAGRISKNSESLDSESLRHDLEDFIEHLNNFNEIKEVVIPIQGLKIEVESFSLGNITFRPTNKALLDKIKKRTEKTMIQNLKQSNDEMSGLRQLVSKQLIDKGLGAFDALAFSETTAEREQAYINALEDVNITLDVLRFLTPYTQKLHEYVGIGIPGQFAKSAYSMIVFSQDGSFGISPIRSRDIPFKIDTLFLERHKKILNILDEVIKKKARTELESRILVAIQWAGRAQSDLQPQQQLLSLITALECLLNPTDGRPYRIGLSESVTLLIGRDEMENRKRLFDFLKSMYDKRSKVSHGGSINMTDSDIRQLQTIVGNVIMAIARIREQFDTRKELESWLDCARLSVILDFE